MKPGNNVRMAAETHFPDRVETERLVLRPYCSQDAQGILDLVENNRAELIREFPQMAKGLRDVEAAKSFTEEKQEQWNSHKTFCYGIWKKHANQPIGQIQVKNIAWEIPAAELGYFIGGKWQRQGYARESIVAILRVAFLERKFQRVFVRILPSNRGSLALALKLAFREEGLHRSAFRCGFGELHDVQVLALTAEEFRGKA